MLVPRAFNHRRHPSPDNGRFKIARFKSELTNPDKEQGFENNKLPTPHSEHSSQLVADANRRNGQFQLYVFVA